MDKAILKEKILEIALQKLRHIEQLISETRASNNDTKSSMGDKYETSREMLQQEINRLLSQRSEIQQQLENLQKLPITTHSKIAFGSFVETSLGSFYISESLGKVQLGNIHCIAISISSPLAQNLLGKSQGELFLIQTKKHHIINIY